MTPPGEVVEVADLEAIAGRLVEQARSEGIALTGDGGLLPALVPHGTRRLDGLEAQVVSLWASGLTTGEIASRLAEIYGTSVSKDTISRITDSIVADMEAWQSRPLDSLYAVMLIDAIVIKVRGAQVANRPVYVAIGVNLEGQRDVLGLWMGPVGR